MIAHSLKNLREMSEEKLINLHDQAAENTVTGVNYYLDELARRSQNKQTETMLLYTKRMLWLTVFIAILTIVNVVVVLVPLA
jgi:hypothetical protein